MKYQKPLTAVLLTFVLVSIGFAMGRAYEARRSGPQSEASTPVLPPDGTALLYFHKPVRCQTCNTIERLAKQTIDTHFTDALAEGRLHWRVYNIKDFDALAREVNVSSSHLVLARIEDGQIVESQVLNEAWTLYSKPEQFEQFITSILQAALNQEPA